MGARLSGFNNYIQDVWEGTILESEVLTKIWLHPIYARIFRLKFKTLEPLFLFESRVMLIQV